MALPNPCDAPLVGRGCDAIGDLAGGAVSSVAGSAFDAAAQKIGEAMTKLLGALMSFWTNVNIPSLDQNSGPVASVQSLSGWLVFYIATGSVLVAAARLAITRNSKAASDAGHGMVIMVAAAGLGVPIVALLTRVSDNWSDWILNQGINGSGAGERFGQLIPAAALTGLGSGLLLIVGILAIFASLAQMLLMVVRVGVITLLAGVLPLAGAAAVNPSGRQWFQKICAWMFAFIIYKPVASLIYATAFFLIGEGQDVVSVLSGLSLIILSVLALPSLMRVIVPAVGAIAGGGGGGAMAAAAGAGALASGAQMVSTGGSRGSNGYAGGTHQPGLIGNGHASGGTTPAAGAAGGAPATTSAWGAPAAGAGVGAGAAGTAGASGTGAAAGAAAGGPAGIAAAGAAQTAASGAQAARKVGEEATGSQEDGDR